MNYDTLATPETLQKISDALVTRGMEGIIVHTKAEALEKIKSLIAPGASVMNGSSVTLEEIGFIEYLKNGAHGWNNLHEHILAEQDKEKQAALRKQSVLSDYYLGSAHAITETGEIVIASNTGSQLPHLVFTSQNIILVVGAQKIAPTLLDALRRIDEYVVPLEDEHMKQKFGVGTLHSKTVILHHENPMMGRKVHILFVLEKLGF
jgi:L-lactate utilization protein LutB